jgi:hypothetical protein
MALITTGVQIGLTKLGDIPWASVWTGVHDVFVGLPGCWQRQCNVSFKGSAAPMMYFGTRYDAKNWAMAYPRGWGRGTIQFSNHPTVVKLWHQYGIERIARSLAAHEAAWHVGAYSYSQEGQWPFTSAMIARWVGHYGKPIVKDEPAPTAAELMVEGR